MLFNTLEKFFRRIGNVNAFSLLYVLRNRLLLTSGN